MGRPCGRDLHQSSLASGGDGECRGSHFPATAHFGPKLQITDEFYENKDFSRDRVRVLMSLDTSSVDMTKPNIERKDGDFALTWVRNYGKGRVFCSALGHEDQIYDRPDMQKMYLEAVKWVLGMTNGDATPRLQVRKRSTGAPPGMRFFAPAASRFAWREAVPGYRYSSRGITSIIPISAPSGGITPAMCADARRPSVRLRAGFLPAGPATRRSR